MAGFVNGHRLEVTQASPASSHPPTVIAEFSFRVSGMKMSATSAARRACLPSRSPAPLAREVADIFRRLLRRKIPR